MNHRAWNQRKINRSRRRGGPGRVMLGVGILALATGCAPPVRIASDALFPPFHFVDDAGQVTGHDIALARAVAREAGLRPTVTIVRPYSALLGGLETDDHDLVAATTGITPERQQRYRFSTPYYHTCQAVVVRAGFEGPRTLAGLQGRRVGASGNGTSARARDGLSGVEAVRLAAGQDGFEALRSGTIDALIIDEFEAVAAARGAPQDFAVLPEPAALEAYGLVMARANSDLQRRINTALERLRAAGRLAELRAEFGVARDGNWPIDRALLGDAGRSTTLGRGN